jgi:hypothetical protein
VVQLWTGDQNRLLSTLLTMPNYDLPTTDKTVFSFFERGAKQPKALRLWFSPGRNYGQEFIYPKAQAVELAKAVGRSVLSMPPELPGDIGVLVRSVVEGGSAAAKAPIAPVVSEPRRVGPAIVTSLPSQPSRQAAAPRLTPLPEPGSRAETSAPGAKPAESRPANVAQPIQSRARARDREAGPEPVRPPASLPRTASYLPVLAVLGMLAITAGTLLRILALRLERQ